MFAISALGDEGNHQPLANGIGHASSEREGEVRSNGAPINLAHSDTVSCANHRFTVHILLLRQHFALPDQAGSSRPYEMATRWIEAGHRVTVLTSSAKLFLGEFQELLPKLQKLAPYKLC